MKYGAMERDDQGEKKLPKMPRYFFARTRNARALPTAILFFCCHICHTFHKKQGDNLENCTQQTRKREDATIPNRLVERYSTTRKMMPCGGFELNNTNNNLTH